MSFGEGNLHVRVEELEQEVADLKGMVGSLPPEGKCAMLIVQRVDGEYVWACEPFDFASYCVVDKGADTVKWTDLNDPFGRADSLDKGAMASVLRKASARLEEQSDALGLIGVQAERIEELESLVRDMHAELRRNVFEVGGAVEGQEKPRLTVRMEELGIEVGE